MYLCPVAESAGGGNGAVLEETPVNRRLATAESCLQLVVFRDMPDAPYLAYAFSLSSLCCPPRGSSTINSETIARKTELFQLGQVFQLRFL